MYLIMNSINKVLDVVMGVIPKEAYSNVPSLHFRVAPLQAGPSLSGCRVCGIPLMSEVVSKSSTSKQFVPLLD